MSFTCLVRCVFLRSWPCLKRWGVGGLRADLCGGWKKQGVSCRGRTLKRRGWGRLSLSFHTSAGRRCAAGGRRNMCEMLLPRPRLKYPRQIGCKLTIRGKSQLRSRNGAARCFLMAKQCLCNAHAAVRMRSVCLQRWKIFRGGFVVSLPCRFGQECPKRRHARNEVLLYWREAIAGVAIGAACRFGRCHMH